jgi:uncharacterized protein with von Willebrand factor type A (vWA) domain
MKNAGEIEIIFERSVKDRLKVILAIDNGGWSMDPYIEMVQTLFYYARAQFKEVNTYFFHNTIYDQIWQDPARYRKPYRIDELVRRDPETRVVIVGDASMAPYELMATDGSIHIEERSSRPSHERLRFIADTFPHAVWINPKMAAEWPYTRSINMIREIFPMFELTIDGLEKAVGHLMSDN